MIKLENPTNAPQAFAALLLQSLSEVPTISISAEPVRSNLNGAWVDDPKKRRQTVTFISSDGSPVTLTGIVEETEAIEIAGAFKVVVLVNPSTELKGAFEAGRVSRAYTALELVRVVEVWSTASKKLWSASEWQSKPGGRSFDPASGKIGAAA